MQAIYRVESRLEGDEIAQQIAIEQSAGRSRTWEGVSEETRELGRAEVVGVSEVEPLPHPLPLWAESSAHERRAYTIRIRYQNWAPRCGLGNLLNVVVGEPQHLGSVLALKVQDIAFSDDEIDAFAGPSAGRDVLAPLGDLVVAPLKPSAGLAPEEAAELAYAAAVGGADIIKDDELAFPGLRDSVSAHCRQVADAVRRAEQVAGKKKRYWANIIMPPGKAFKLAPHLTTLGVDGLITAPAIQGFDICSDLREITDLALIAHNTTATTAMRVEGFGIDMPVWMKLQRLGGADALLAPSPYGSFGIDPAQAAASIRASAQVWGSIRPALYCHSGGVAPRNVRTLKALAPDVAVAFTAGSAIFDHPDGPSSGAEELRTAVDCIHREVASHE